MRVAFIPAVVPVGACAELVFAEVTSSKSAEVSVVVWASAYWIRNACVIRIDTDTAVIIEVQVPNVEELDIIDHPSIVFRKDYLWAS